MSASWPSACRPPSQRAPHGQIARRAQTPPQSLITMPATALALGVLLLLTAAAQDGAASAPAPAPEAEAPAPWVALSYDPSDPDIASRVERGRQRQRPVPCLHLRAPAGSSPPTIPIAAPCPTACSQAARLRQARSWRGRRSWWLKAPLGRSWPAASPAWPTRGGAEAGAPALARWCAHPSRAPARMNGKPPCQLTHAPAGAPRLRRAQTARHPTGAAACSDMAPRSAPTPP